MVSKTPFKTPREKRMNKYYMSFLNSNKIIDEMFIERFKKHVEVIRKENPIYNQN